MRVFENKVFRKIKVKVKLPFTSLIKHYAMKAYGGRDV
jgi:hypothetical protein